MAKELHHQIVGNVWLYFVCYRLSLLGWNAMPTTRNSKGIDVLIYNQDATRTHSIQVKALSKKSPVPLGSNLNRLMGDYFIICRSVVSENPECFILTPNAVRIRAHRGEMEGRVSYWLQPKDYAVEEFHEMWDQIGSGAEE